MIEVMRTTDPVLITYVQAMLEEAGIGSAVLDTNISILEGSIGLFPRRIMVIDEDAAQAREVLLDSKAADSLGDKFRAGKW